MKLSVAERIGLLQILPGSGDFLTFKVVNDLKNALSFSEEEIKTLGMKTEQKEEGRVMTTWNRSEEKPKEISIGDKAGEVIESSLKELDKQKKIDAMTYPLYLLFVKDAQEPEKG